MIKFGPINCEFSHISLKLASDFIWKHCHLFKSNQVGWNELWIFDNNLKTSHFLFYFYLYKNITIYLNQIEFVSMNDEFSIITLKIVFLFENISICSYQMKFGPINCEFSIIILKIVIL